MFTVCATMKIRVAYIVKEGNPACVVVLYAQMVFVGLLCDVGVLFSVK